MKKHLVVSLTLMVSGMVLSSNVWGAASSASLSSKSLSAAASSPSISSTTTSTKSSSFSGDALASDLSMESIYDDEDLFCLNYQSEKFGVTGTPLGTMGLSVSATAMFPLSGKPEDETSEMKKLGSYYLTNVLVGKKQCGCKNYTYLSFAQATDGSGAFTGKQYIDVMCSDKSSATNLMSYDLEKPSSDEGWCGCAYELGAKLAGQCGCPKGSKVMLVDSTVEGGATKVIQCVKSDGTTENRMAGLQIENIEMDAFEVSDIVTLEKKVTNLDYEITAVDVDACYKELIADLAPDEDALASVSSHKLAKSSDGSQCYVKFDDGNKYAVIASALSSCLAQADEILTEEEEKSVTASVKSTKLSARKPSSVLDSSKATFTK